MLSAAWLASLLFMMPALSASGQPSQSRPDNGQETDWMSLTSYLSQVVTDTALGLPPAQQDLSFLRLSLALAELCHKVYAQDSASLQDVFTIQLPQRGRFSAPANVTATLLHFRQASVDRELASPQQYGVWVVDGLGIVIAFRGTASTEDVLVDVNITPTPLEGTFARGQAPIRVHRGFYSGAKQHAEAIVALVNEAKASLGAAAPVWVTGHSLGGGYANALLLHLLAQRQGGRLFSAGGGAVTFGAPQVVFSEDPAALYSALSSLESRGWSARQARRPANAELHFHNFVNNADVVPRLLGQSLEAVHDSLQYYLPSYVSMQSVRQQAQHYQPFGAYHFLLGSTVRTPPPEHTAPGGVAGHMGNAAYAEVIRTYLGVSNLWKSVYATAARGGGVSHHSLVAYRANLRLHAEDVAFRMPAAGSAGSSVLFAPRPGLGECPVHSSSSRGLGTHESGSDDAMEQLARVVGQHGRQVISQLSESGWANAGSLSSSLFSAASTRWQAYRDSQAQQADPAEQVHSRADARSRARAEADAADPRSSTQTWGQYFQSFLPSQTPEEL